MPCLDSNNKLQSIVKGKKKKSEETKHASKPDSNFRISNGLKKGYGKYAKGSNGKSEQHVRTNGNKSRTWKL